MAELARRSEWLAARGIAYVVVVGARQVHDLSRAPAALGRARRRRPTPYDRVARRDRARRPRHVRRPARRRCCAAKARERVYYKTDSHWNFNGAIVGYDEIMRAVQKALLAGKLAEIAPAAAARRTRPASTSTAATSCRCSACRRASARTTWRRSARCSPTPTAAARRRIDKGEFPGFEFYVCDQPGLPRAVVLRDSMAISLIPLLSENFSRVVYVSTRAARPRADRAREARHRDRGAGRALAARARRVPDEVGSGRPLEADAPAAEASTPSS